MDDRPECFCGGYRAGDVQSPDDPVLHTLSACNTWRPGEGPLACESCRFWQGGAEGQTHMGRCRRYPAPQPITKASHWCGEHHQVVQTVKLEPALAIDLGPAFRGPFEHEAGCPQTYDIAKACLCETPGQ